MKHKAGIRECRVQHVTEYLQNKLLPLPYGGQLPGIRTIMAQTGCGRLTVSHALQNLIEAGYIQVRPDRGIFLTKPSEKSDEIRLLHWSLNSLDRSGFVSTLFRSLKRYSAEAGRKITVENVRNRSREEDIAEELIAHGISRCILYGSQSSEFSRYLHRHMKVCLEILPRHEDRVAIELRDAPDMTVRQMDYLLKCGYRRIGYLHFCGSDMFHYPVQVQRLMDYYRLMAENGLKVEPSWVFYCSEHYENLESGMDAMAAASCLKPEVLIVPGAALLHLYPYCRKRGIRIGKDLALFSQDEIQERLSPAPTTITNNPEEIAQTFWRMFQAAERGEQLESAYTKLFIRTGETVPVLRDRVRSRK